MKSVACVLFASLVVSIALVNGTMVQDCKTGADSQDPNRVSISECDAPPCRLRRKHDVIVEAKFKTDKEVKTLRNSVTAMILGLPLPFIGVDGTSACANIFAEDGTKAGCPLKADTNYIYKNSFKVLDIYPKIKTTVSWALTDGSDGSKPLCFNVKVRITG